MPPRARQRKTQKHLFHLLGAILALALMLGVIGYLVNRNTTLENNLTQFQQQQDQRFQDFPSTEEGSFSGTIKATADKQPQDSIIILFASAKIPGMTLLYYPEQQRLVGGTPQLVAEDIALFDGKEHRLTYSFKKNNKQQLYYDNQLIAEGPFHLYERSILTGLVTGTTENVVSNRFKETIFS